MSISCFQILSFLFLFFNIWIGLFYELWSSPSSFYQGCSLLWCDTVWYVRYIPMFQKDLLPPYSGRRAGSSKMLVLSCQLNSFTFRKTIILHYFTHSTHKFYQSFLVQEFFFFIIFTSLRYWHISKPLIHRASMFPRVYLLYTRCIGILPHYTPVATAYLHFHRIAIRK